MLHRTRHPGLLSGPEPENHMSEMNQKNGNGADQAQKYGTAAVEKIIAEQTTRFEAALTEMGKLQGNTAAQVNLFVEGATRVAHEQIAFAEQLGGEWRKLLLAATHGTADLFAPKA
jgi:hypothetical protein